MDTIKFFLFKIGALCLVARLSVKEGTRRLGNETGLRIDYKWFTAKKSQ